MKGVLRGRQYPATDIASVAVVAGFAFMALCASMPSVAAPNDILFSENPPTATATFGTYRGNDRIIYRREVAQ